MSSHFRAYGPVRWTDIQERKRQSTLPFARFFSALTRRQTIEKSEILERIPGEDGLVIVGRTRDPVLPVG